MRVEVRRCRRCRRPMVSQSAWRRYRWLREHRRPHRGRGLCDSCFEWASRCGVLDRYPRSTWTADELLDEWQWLRSDGVRVDQAAVRIGVSPVALDRALHRALARGDQRGRHSCAGMWKARAA